jgi:hypothetical protein
VRLQQGTTELLYPVEADSFIGNHKDRASRQLGLARSSLFKKLKDWGLGQGEESENAGRQAGLSPSLSGLGILGWRRWQSNPQTGSFSRPIPFRPVSSRLVPRRRGRDGTQAGIISMVGRIGGREQLPPPRAGYPPQEGTEGEGSALARVGSAGDCGLDWRRI